MRNLYIILFTLFLTTLCFGQKAYIVTKNANLRKLPNGQSEIIAEIPLNSQIQVTSKKHLNGWYSVNYKKKKGWMHGNTFSFNKIELVYEKPNLPPILVDWYFIDETTGKDRRFYYYQPRKIKTDVFDNSSGWLKVIPVNPAIITQLGKFNKNVSYYLIFATVDCKQERLSLESPIFYDKNDQILTGKIRISNSYREPIVPNSVGEAIHLKFCE